MGKMTLKLPLCLLAGLYLATAQALTVSEIELHSRLNEPLDARVRLDGISSTQLESLVIKIIRGDDNVGRSLINLDHEVVADGAASYVQITSRELVREPVVMFTLELSWSEGRLLREYTMLLDPKY
jgi:pilus assembly protein FimV